MILLYSPAFVFVSYYIVTHLTTAPRPCATVVRAGVMTDVRATERGPSPLASKNPFRNLVSDTTAARPMSTNPFLDSNEIISSDAAAKTAPTTATEKVASQASVTETTANLFVSLTQSLMPHSTDSDAGKSRSR